MTTQLNTRIVLRNDSSAKWLENESVILLKGEVGIEFTTDGKVKIKIGDGVKTWAQLDYFGGASEETLDLIKTQLVDINNQIIENSENISAQNIVITELQDDLADLIVTNSTLTARIETNEDNIALLNTNLANVYTKEETNTAITTAVNNSDHLKRKIVISIDSIDVNAVDAEHYIYMVINESGTYDEYMVLDGELEKVGDWKVDLSDYAKTSDVAAVQNELALITQTVNQHSSDLSQLNTTVTNLSEIIGDADAENGLLQRVSAAEVNITNLINDKANKATTLEGYGITDAYTKSEISDLIADITGGESAADVLAELTAYKSSNDNRVAALEAIGAEKNTIETISFNDVIVEPDENRHVKLNYTLPAAMADTLGGVKSSDKENQVSVNKDGYMEVNDVNVNKLVQTDGDTLILNGGSSAI